MPSYGDDSRGVVGRAWAIADNVAALASRPVHARRHKELEREYQAPPDAWWADDDRWFPADTPPRRGNRLTPLVDGEQAMRAMYEAIDGAQESILIAAWFLTPGLRLIRPPDDPSDPPTGKGGPHAFLTLIARKASEVDVRILMWPGALVGKFAKRRVERNRRALLSANPRLRIRLDTHEHLSHCQHQKTLVVDGRVAFVGGLDVTAFDADRWDVQQHTFRKSRNWHDAHWQLEGPCVADVAANFTQRWDATAPDDPVPTSALTSHPMADWPPDPYPRDRRSSAPLPAAGEGEQHTSFPPAAGEGELQRGDAVVQVQRTIPKGVYPFAPRGVYGIAHAYRRAIARARRFIYLENQYLWSPEITDALREAIERGRDTDLRIALVLPSHPNVGKGDTDRHIDTLTRADGGRGIFRAYALYTSCWDDRRHRYKYRPIYVHAKIAVIDDEWGTVGSANLNGRGMAGDSEINVTTTDRASLEALRLHLWAEHLNCGEAELRGTDPATLLKERWVATATEQQRIAKARSGLLTAAAFPYTTGHVDADFGPGEVESALLDR